MTVKAIRVCLNNRGDMRYSCMASGCRDTLKSVKEKFGADHTIKPWTCMGHCNEGPMLCVIDADDREHYITKGNLEELQKVLAQHVD